MVGKGGRRTNQTGTFHSICPQVPVIRASRMLKDVQQQWHNTRVILLRHNTVNDSEHNGFRVPTLENAVLLMLARTARVEIACSITYRFGCCALSPGEVVSFKRGSITRSRWRASVPLSTMLQSLVSDTAACQWTLDYKPHKADQDKKTNQRKNKPRFRIFECIG